RPMVSAGVPGGGNLAPSWLASGVMIACLDGAARRGQDSTDAQESPRRVFVVPGAGPRELAHGGSSFHHARPRPLPRRARPEGDVSRRRPPGERLRTAGIGPRPPPRTG